MLWRNSSKEDELDQKEGKKKKKTEKCQHFLHLLIHVKRARQWLAESRGNEEERKRSVIRKMAVMRDDPTTGCAGNWLNVVPCRVCALSGLGDEDGRSRFQCGVEMVDGSFDMAD